MVIDRYIADAMAQGRGLGGKAVPAALDVAASL